MSDIEDTTNRRRYSNSIPLNSESLRHALGSYQQEVMWVEVAMYTTASGNQIDSGPVEEERHHRMASLPRMGWASVQVVVQSVQELRVRDAQECVCRRGKASSLPHLGSQHSETREDVYKAGALR